MLAIRVMQDQGVDIEAVNFRTMFSCCKEPTGQAARLLQVPFTVLHQEDDYVDVIRQPRHGYGKGANPCVDCRVYMFRHAKRVMEQVGADLVISGEVVGQRPMSQKRRDLLIIARESGLEDRLLRPLSAKLLAPTLPERTGQIDRERLFAFHGRGRKELAALAQFYGFTEIPPPSTGCPLAETSFAGKVHDLIRFDLESAPWDFELLKVGRHIRTDARTKVIVGRQAADNERLRWMYRQPGSRASALLVPTAFRGPTVLVVGPATDETLTVAGSLLLRFAKDYDPETAWVECDVAGQSRRLPVRQHDQAAQVATL
jgi:hypothetical protein